MKRLSAVQKTVFLFCTLLLIGWMLGNGACLSASGGEEGTFPFPKMAGWKQSEEAQIFSRVNLYDYINGGADLYLKYDFQELTVAEYQNDRKCSITIEVYRHKTPIHAFGIYSQERLNNANYMEVGAQGYSEKGVLNFLAGDCYVKMSSVDVGPEEREVLLAFARKVVENIGGKGSLPSILSAFPREGEKKNSEKFISREFLGYSFFHSAFTADYELSGKRFKLFLIEGKDQKDCQYMIQEYLKHTGNLQSKVEEGRYQLKDPYHGGMDFYWKGNYIWGALDLADETVRFKVLKLFAEGLELAKNRTLDMTYPYDENTIYWPNATNFKLAKGNWGMNDAGQWYAANDYSAAEHGGTHVDAPIHFSRNGRTVDQIPLAEWIGPTVKIDVTKKCEQNRDYLLTTEDIVAWEKRHGRIPDRAWVIMYTGIGTKFYPDRKKVLGTDIKGIDALPHLSFPGFSSESAEFLVKERNIRGIAIDTPSIDYGKSQDFRVHRVICGADRLALENIASLDKLPETGAMLYAIPMLIGDGTGSPARVFAVLP
ncbi:MAG: DUF6599 family protein [Syntrophales bacterium]